MVIWSVVDLFLQFRQQMTAVLHKRQLCSLPLFLTPLHNLRLYLSLPHIAIASAVGLLHTTPESQHSVEAARKLVPCGHPEQNQAKPISLAQSHGELVISVIKSITLKTQLAQVHAHILRTSLVHDPKVSLHFLSRVALSGPFQDTNYARHFFGQISCPSVYLYNTMIRAYSMSNSPEQGFYLYRDMRRRGFRIDPLSSSSAIKSCIKIPYLLGGVQVHGCILKDGHQSDSLLLTALMDIYSQCGKCDEACKLFDEMPQKDTVAWNVLISSYIRNNRTRDALDLFHIMQSGSYKCQPDDVTCLLLLQACAHLNALEFGERIHGYMLEHGYVASKLSNCLTHMYSRCGCLDKAYEVFKASYNKDVVSWSAMISGLAMNGYGGAAIEAFEEMQRMGIRPDDQIFTGVLSACSHSGLVDAGMAFFHRMSEEFGITPNIHHYGCVVDLLGRAGLLDQAYQLIMSMVVTPDSTIWRTLLGACRIHRHVRLGELIIGHLIELKAQEAGDYVLLLNMYSSAGQWEKVAEVRKLMKEESIQTTPGCSTIELKGVVHEFVVDDTSHRRIKEIYQMLAEINAQLKIAGYVAELSSESHKLDDKGKQYVLCYHSEKLAIAFGVLATPPGTTLRVANNLRICVDCHNFMKFFSSVYNRDLIVRDRKRVHHFRGGHCSCSDYW